MIYYYYYLCLLSKSVVVVKDVLDVEEDGLDVIVEDGPDDMDNGRIEDVCPDTIVHVC